MVAIQFFELEKLSSEQYSRIMKRAELDISHMLPLAQEVAHEVRANGDAGVVKYARQWDAKNFEASMLRASSGSEGSGAPNADVARKCTSTAPAGPEVQRW